MLKNYYDAFKEHANKQETRTNANKVKVSLISISLGLLAGTIIVWIMGSNPIDFISQLFTSSFKNSATINQLLIFVSIFTMSGLANAFAFKTGLFNIGVSGQMLAGGGVAMYLSLTVFNDMNKVLAIPLLFIIAALIAGFIGLIVGLLKTIFNIHEVVSTILLNWIIFYLIKYIFTYTVDPGSRKYMTSSGESEYTNHTFANSGIVTDGGWQIAVIVTIIAVITIFLILKFTILGKNLKMTGINIDGAKYAGINTKKAVITSLVISSLLAGLLGVIFYFGAKGSMPTFTSNTLPAIGFDGIALALLAFSNPIGIVPVGILYGVFKVSGFSITSLPPAYANELISLVFSIMIYFAAISTLFYRFKPLSFIYKQLMIRKKQEIGILIISNKSSENKLYDKLKLISDKKSDEYKNKLILYKILKRDNQTKVNDLHMKLFNEEIKLNYQISKSYVNTHLHNKRKLSISFAKMSLNTNVLILMKNKNIIKDLRKEIRELRRSKSDGYLKSMKNLTSKINGLKSLIKHDKSRNVQQLVKLKKDYKKHIDMINKKEKIRRNLAFIEYDKLNIRNSKLSKDAKLRLVVTINKKVLARSK
ncbi:ABC transporter permease subunit [Candidatus Mycoplasma mahonii]|uniref:ABC transporter permease subunit n=1 Tax=Candidatus Mycoplasma mahonii TaxID=3004105 RepID=UPI0026ED4BE8|nr:hypothetical protein [Candidatus Mycoplasma mahonii]WKX02256.1 hypothetical protein O3I44_02530 [Candidatus Mycoplasma mahonii]